MDARLDRAAQKRIPGFKKSYRRRADAENGHSPIVAD
jgi:hypothetical protein